MVWPRRVIDFIAVDEWEGMDGGTGVAMVLLWYCLASAA